MWDLVWFHVPKNAEVFWDFQWWLKFMREDDFHHWISVYPIEALSRILCHVILIWICNMQKTPMWWLAPMLMVGS
jgi:hypothetical protein